MGKRAKATVVRKEIERERLQRECGVAGAGDVRIKRVVWWWYGDERNESDERVCVGVSECGVA